MRKTDQNELNNNIGSKKIKNNTLHAGKLAEQDSIDRADKITHKLAFYIGSLNKGGAERVFINLAEYFLKQGYRVVMVTQYRKEDEYELPAGIARVISDITPQETTKSRLVNFFRRVGRLHRIWQKEQPDLVLSCVGKNNFMAVVTTMFTKTKPVVSVVGEAAEEYPNFLMKTLADILFPFAAGIILQTERSRSFFSRRIGKTAVILPNSLNPAFLRPRYEGVREKRIVSVGRLDANKNHEMMIRAFVRLMDRYPEYTLTIYGEGDLHGYLQEMTDSLGVAGRVFLPGVIPDVAGQIEKASLFLLTSYSEGVSNALIEAMALGLPVIATDVPSGGTVELIKDGENGLVIPVGEEDALVAAMDRVLSDAALAKRLGEEAHRLQERLAPERVNRQWQAYFEQCIRKVN
ncbi:MAG: glycosyltransferase [Roseburia sp.]|nr:glycosyltransferase [Roseburia sp.]MCM1241612.1 glycosyltransferase [Roseburia sp.]